MTSAVGEQLKTRAGARSRRRRRMLLAFLGADAAMTVLAGLVAAYARFGTVFSRAAIEGIGWDPSFAVVTITVTPLWIVSLYMSGMYDLDRIAWRAADPGRVLRALSLSVVVLILGSYALKAPGLSRGWLLLFWILSVSFVVIGRGVASILIVLMRRRGKLLRPALIVGSNRESSDIIRVLRGNVEAGLVPVGCLASSQAERLSLDFTSSDVPVLGSARELCEVVASAAVDTVVIASSAFDHDVVARMIAELRNVDVDVHISSGLLEVLTSRVSVNEVAGVPLITVKGLSLSRTNVVIKRGFDLLVASSILLIGLPLWLAVAAGVKFTSPGPVFYGQARVGRSGRSFKMLKFRSMYSDADERLAELRNANEASGPMFKMKDDPRVTPIGKWMRKFSVDEFPQLINVLRGEMSLVGPRPPLPVEVERYSSHDWRRLEVLPGMTGLWQTSGRSSLTFDEMVRLDLFYIENWSVALDMTLLLRTVPAVLLARGAY